MRCLEEVHQARTIQGLVETDEYEVLRRSVISRLRWPEPLTVKPLHSCSRRENFPLGAVNPDYTVLTGETMPTEARPDPTAMAIETWSLGEYTQLARDLLPVATQLVETTDVSEGDRVLDIACGSGNVALTAWRRGATVTGSDLVPRMLEFAGDNASIMGADDIEWRQADAAALPFEDDSFDVVLSCFGHIAAFDPDAAGRELVRVTKPGGRIAYSSWTPDGLTRPILETLAEYTPPDAPQDSPADTLWADLAVAPNRLGKDVEDVTVHHKVLPYHFLSPQHFWTHLAEYTGPFVAIRNQVGESDRKALDRAVIDALEPYFEENALRFEYALVSAKKR